MAVGSEPGLSAADVLAALPEQLRTGRDFVLEGIRSFGWDFSRLLPHIPPILRDTDAELVQLAVQKSDDIMML